MPHILLAVNFNDDVTERVIKAKVQQLGGGLYASHYQTLPANLPLVSAHSIAQQIEVTAIMSKHLSLRSGVLNHLMTELLPLLSNETEQKIENNLYVLQSPWLHIQPGTVFIKRKTNIAEYYLCNPAVKFVDAKVSINRLLRFNGNCLIWPANICSSNDKMLDIILTMNAVLTQSVYGYQLNNLISFRLSIFPRYGDFEWLATSDYHLPLLDNMIQDKYKALRLLWSNFKKILKITEINRESIHCLLVHSAIFNKACINISNAALNAPIYELVETIFIFSVDLVLQKDLAVYYLDQEHEAMANLARSNYRKKLNGYSQFIRLATLQEKDSSFYSVFVDLADSWSRLAEAEIHTSDLQHIYFNMESRDSYQRKINYSQGYFLSQLQTNQGD